MPMKKTNANAKQSYSKTKRPAEPEETFTRIKNEIGKVIIGQDETITEIIISILSGGHILLNGLPGLAKTLMVRSLSKIFDLRYNRIQFTPDLMPADLIGYEMIEEKKHGKTLKFIQGPLFTQILLADEINRSPAKTQAALLEAMEEKNITVMGKTYKLEEPFLVLATQNPLEQKGTYELPEAELDRFMSMINIQYPKYDEEIKIAVMNAALSIQKIKKIFTKKQYLDTLAKCQQVKASPEAIEWIVRLVRSTRPKEEDSLELSSQYVESGASVRATQHLIRAAKTSAFLERRNYIEKQDIVKTCSMILRHRIKLNYEADANNISNDAYIQEVLQRVPSP